MSDYVQLNTMSGGDQVAADDVGGVKYQRIKPAFGVDGAAQDVDDTHGLPVNVVTPPSTLPLPTGAATETTLGTLVTTTDFDTKVGSLTETAPATDTASSGLNGRLQRIAQRLTSLLALLPGSLGQKAKANSLAVTLASDQDALSVTGTFFQATQPVSAAALPLPTGAAVEAGGHLAAIDTNTGAIADAAVSAGATGSIAAKLRAISRDIVANIVLAAGSAIIGKVGIDQTTPGTTNAVQITTNKTLKTKDFSLSATGTIVNAVATKRIKVYAIKLVPSAACSVNLRDGGSTGLEGAQSLAANGGYVESVPPPAFLLATAAGNSLDLVISGSATVAGRVSYWDDDAS